MKLAFVTAFPSDPQQPRGGVEAASVTLVRALAKEGSVEVQVVTMDRSIQSPRRDTFEGVAVHRLPWRGRWILTGSVGSSRRQLLDFLDTLAPDVVHAHDTYGLMAAGCGRPRVLTIHGFIHADTRLTRQRMARFRSAIWRRFEERAWADYPHIISISPYVRERLAGIASGVIHDVDNPIELRFFDLQRQEAGPIIFSAGMIGRRKNPIALVEALGRLRRRGIDAKLRLAGPIAEPDYSRRLDQRIAMLDLCEHVERLGAIGLVRIGEELERASVFALASREENSPMSIEEAMAAGCPVVTSNRCGMPYLVRDGETGFLIDPEDPADIADRLEEILTNAPRRASMAESSRAIARARFHPDVVAMRTIDIYRRAARGTIAG